MGKKPRPPNCDCIRMYLIMSQQHEGGSGRSRIRSLRLGTRTQNRLNSLDTAISFYSLPRKIFFGNSHIPQHPYNTRRRTSPSRFRTRLSRHLPPAW